ncbi:MAG: sulfatase-like hydrolase/transferase, partial [Planctomycetaceae bacterium]|nr:sulfatase-like hydrolase/transferase [Planctomycetaceae bacterium]
MWCHRRSWCGLFVGAWMLAALASLSAAERPNIIFVFTDDQASWALGASGNSLAKTPHMDRLAKEGVYLPNSFTTTPVCSPSRASLMTSRYGSELGITDWIHPRNEPRLGLDPALPVWPRLLAEAGYQTGLVGKWHLGLLDSQHPTRFGFQHFMGHRAGGWATVNPTLEKDGKQQKFQGLTADILADHFPWCVEYEDDFKELFREYVDRKEKLHCLD